MKLIDFFRKNKSTGSAVDNLSYLECEDAVDASLVWLDNHPNATLEEYEVWLDSRDKAIKKIKENYGGKDFI